MPLTGNEIWPVLENGPVAVRRPGAAAWVHEGYRMHLAGQGAQLHAVRAGAVLMEAIEHERGDELVLHADRAETRRGGLICDRWATALELPLFVWECAAGGTISWTTPAPGASAELNGAGTRLVLRSSPSTKCAVFEVSAGSVVVTGGGRITWSVEGAGRLVAIAASDDADLERSLDLLARRSLPGLGRQRMQHAEQLHRGGAAMRAAASPTLSDAFDWAKVRADALLGAWIAGSRDESLGHDAPFRLAEGLLAAGLSQLPRALRRLPGVHEHGHSAEYSRLAAAWIGELPEGRDSGKSSGEHATQRERPADRRHRANPGADAIAAGQVAADAIASFLSGAVQGRWGVEPDAEHGALILAPDIGQLGPAAALSRLRIGRTVLDLRLRSRGEVVSMAIRRGSGPPITVDCGLRGADVGELLVDGQAVTGNRARFEVRDAHDLQLRLLGRPPLSSAPS